jgi:hypothetical protein
VGDATRYQLLNLNITTPLSPTTFVTGSFNPATAPGTTPVLSEDFKYYQYVCQNGYWVLNPDNQPTSGLFDLTINPVGLVCQAVFQTIAKRNNSGSAWTFGGSTFSSFTRRNGFNSFSEIAQIDAEQPLPLDLLSFFGLWKGPHVELEWETANERDLSHIVVERSENGTSFVEIGKLQGSSANGQKYHFMDMNPGNLNVYRLKEVDLDGSFTFSDVILLKRNALDAFVKVMPNPVRQSNDVFVELLATDLEEFQVFIHDITGKVVGSQLVITQLGLNRFALDHGNALPKGIYTVQFMGLNENASDHHPIKLVVD